MRNHKFWFWVVSVVFALGGLFGFIYWDAQQRATVVLERHQADVVLLLRKATPLNPLNCGENASPPAAAWANGRRSGRWSADQ